MIQARTNPGPKAQSDRADGRAAELAPILTKLRASGITSSRAPVPVSELEVRARTAGLLGEHQQIGDAKKFRGAKKGLASRRGGTGLVVVAGGFGVALRQILIHSASPTNTCGELRALPVQQTSGILVAAPPKSETDEALCWTHWPRSSSSVRASAASKPRNRSGVRGSRSP
jgi:hypothetical protein